MVADGEDPRIKAVKTLTFAQAMEATIEVLRPGWKGPKTEAQMRNQLEQYALPHIGPKPIDAICSADVLMFLAPLALEKPATAGKLKSALGQVFKWSIAQGLRTDNPANQDINAALPKLSTREHRRALEHKDVSQAVKVVRDSNAWMGTKLALEFLILTAGRSGEIRLAEWREIDTEARTWTIPAGRMKSDRPHRVPLSARALAVLQEARPLADDSGLIFPSSTGKALSDSTLSKLIRENGIQAVPHGFRSSFRDWCADSGIDRQTAETALAHSVGDATEVAYLRSDLLEQRQSLMQQWADSLGLVREIE
jgi:integrase